MIRDEFTAREVAGLLLDLGAVQLRPEEPFTWASGWRSPIYCDNRLVLSDPACRRKVRDLLAQGIRERFPDVETVAGVATAGIPHGVLVAEDLDLPYIYVRSKAKGHGKGNRIEGRFEQGARVAVIEDLVSTGGSSLSAIEALREAGAEVVGLAAIFTYGFPQAVEAFVAADCEWFSLSDYSHLLKEAGRRELINDAQRHSLNRWREDPANWSAASQKHS